MCECKSYNLGVGTVGEVSVLYPYSGKQVLIDACIVEDVQAVWIAGFETLGSCCGHNLMPANVVVPDWLSEEQVFEVLKILMGESPEKHWGVWQWEKGRMWIYRMVADGRGMSRVLVWDTIWFE